MADLKLSIELVPEPCWYNNMRKVLPPTEWDKIRRRVYHEYHHSCGICGAHDTRLSCHEIWEYDDEHHIQRLKGFIALCDLCHYVKHIGYAGLLASEGKVDMQLVIHHFCQVNDCTVDAFTKHEEAAFDLWNKRNHHEWVTDLGKYQQSVT
ncbi:MAG: HNH endonuclease [Chloroflexi bacterium]|nr:MAG: HNH endonuclease [Chloroflexota bacterium]